MKQTVFTSKKNITSLIQSGEVTQFEKDWLFPQHPGATRVFCHVFDRRNLEGSRACLAHYHENDHLVHAQNALQYPEEQIKFIHTLLRSIQYQTKMERPAKKKKKDGKKGKGGKKKKGGSGSGGMNDDEAMEDEDDPVEDEEQEADDEQGDQSNKNKDQTLFQDGTNTLHRVVVAIEDLVSDEGVVIGWRYFFIVNDPTFNLSRELKFLLMRNEIEIELKRRKDERENRKRAKSEKSPFLSDFKVKNKEEWVNFIMTNVAVDKDFSEDKLAMLLDIDDPCNPAHLGKICSFEQSCKLIEKMLPECKEVYWKNTSNVPGRFEKANYVTYSDMRFPEPIRILATNDRKPAVFHHARLIENDVTRRDIVGLRPEQQKRQIARKHEEVIAADLLHADDIGDIIQMTLELNEEAFSNARKIAQEKYERDLRVNPSLTRPLSVYVSKAYDHVRSTSEFKERWVSLVSNPDSLSPGISACVKYVKDTSVTHFVKTNMQWSAITKDSEKLDPNMSFFSHMMAREAMWYENTFKIDSNHQEMTLLNILSLSLFDSRPKPLYPHTLMSGAAAIGKSYITDILKTFMIEGTYHLCGHESELAFANGRSFSNMMLIWDEISKQFMMEKTNGGNDEQQGSSLLKTMLSNNEIRKNTTVFNPVTREHESKTVVSKLETIILGSMNASADILPAPLRSRIIVVPIDKFNREGVNSTTAPHRARSQEEIRICEYNKKIQAMVCLVELAMKTGFIPQVDLTAASLRWAQIRRHMQKHASIYLDNRRDKNIMSFARTFCLKEATNRVFGTTEIFEYGKPFDWCDVFAVAPFLASTEEHLIFGLTLLDGVLSNVQLDRVAQAINEMTKRGDPPVRNYLSEEKVGIDYSRILLEVPRTKGAVEDILQRASEMISSKMIQMRLPAMHSMNVLSVLHYMLKQTVNSKVYSDDAGTTASNVKYDMPMLSVTTAVTKSGLEISRQFLDNLNINQEGVLEKAIRGTMSKFTTQRLILRGQTYRGARFNYTPFVYQTLLLKPTSEDLTIDNVDYRMSSHRQTMSGLMYEPPVKKDGETQDSQMFKEDEEKKHRFMLRVYGSDMDDEEDVDLTKLVSMTSTMSLSQSTTPTLEVIPEGVVEESLNPEKYPHLRTELGPRYVQLHENLDIHFFKQFIEENGLLHCYANVRSRTRDPFPVCSTWQIIPNSTEMYPIKQRLEYWRDFGNRNPNFDKLVTETATQSMPRLIGPRGLVAPPAPTFNAPPEIANNNNSKKKKQRNPKAKKHGHRGGQTTTTTTTTGAAGGSARSKSSQEEEEEDDVSMRDAWDDEFFEDLDGGYEDRPFVFGQGKRRDIES